MVLSRVSRTDRTDRQDNFFVGIFCWTPRCQERNLKTEGQTPEPLTDDFRI